MLKTAIKLNIALQSILERGSRALQNRTGRQRIMNQGLEGSRSLRCSVGETMSLLLRYNAVLRSVALRSIIRFRLIKTLNIFHFKYTLIIIQARFLFVESLRVFPVFREIFQVKDF